MKSEQIITFIPKLNEKAFSLHKISSNSNKDYKIESDKISLYKTKLKIVPNILNSNAIINNKKKQYPNISKGKFDKKDILSSKTIKKMKIKKNNLKINNQKKSQKNFSNSKKLPQNENGIIDIKLKDYQGSTLIPKNKIKKNKKYTLFKINNDKKNQEFIIRKKNDISTDFLFKYNKTNSKDSINKTYKKGNNFLISYFSKQKESNINFEGKVYNSNNNILDINKKFFKKKNNLINKINTSTLIQNKRNHCNNNSIILKNSQNGLLLNHKEYFTNHLNNIDKEKSQKNNSNKKITKVNNIKKIAFINSISISNNKDSGYLNHKIFEIDLNNTSHHNYFPNNIKTIDSHSSEKKRKKNNQKKIVIQKIEKLEKEKMLKKFKTDKNLQLVELDKNIYQLINKKKNKFLDKENSMSLNNINSFYLKNNKNLTIVNDYNYDKMEKNLFKKLETSENIIGINEYKLSPIKPKEKKFIGNSLNIINGLKKKQNIKYINSKDKTNDDNLNKNINKNNNNLLKNSIKKEKKNLSMQIETKYIYKINKNKKNKIFLKNYYTIENNNMDINNRNISNSIQNKLLDFTYTIQSRNNTSYLKNYNSNYCKNTNIKNSKRKIGNIDFDIMEKNKNKKICVKEKKIKNETHGSKIKNIYKNTKDNKNFIQNIKNRENIKTAENEKSRKLFKKKDFINDLFSEEELEEDFLKGDTSQSTNNIIKINNKMQGHFMNVVKHRPNSKIKFNRMIFLSLIPLFKEAKIINNIINFCNYNALNKISLLNKQHYKYIKPYIYNKIRINIIRINKNYFSHNNIIKKSIFQYTPLSKLSPVMVQKKYKDLLYELNEQYDIEIKKDLLRTSPDNTSFQYGNENYNKLYHILSAYSNYNKNIGYAQGLNFLAAQCIYIYKNEIEAFIFLDGLIRKFNLENFFGKENNKLNLKLKEIEYIVNKSCPSVNKHLKNIFLNYDFFTCKWMITLFSHFMNVKYLTKLWDFLIIFGWKFFNGFVISVIKFNERNILNSTLETITKIMNDILKTKLFENNFDKIIDCTFEFLNEENSIL